MIILGIIDHIYQFVPFLQIFPYLYFQEKENIVESGMNASYVE
jgi:hypothetical protein